MSHTNKGTMTTEVLNKEETFFSICVEQKENSPYLKYVAAHFCPCCPIKALIGLWIFCLYFLLDHGLTG